MKFAQIVDEEAFVDEAIITFQTVNHTLNTSSLMVTIPNH
jgi:hypothetical protein